MSRADRDSENLIILIAVAVVITVFGLIAKYKTEIIFFGVAFWEITLLVLKIIAGGIIVVATAWAVIKCIKYFKRGGQQDLPDSKAEEKTGEEKISAPIVKQEIKYYCDRCRTEITKEEYDYSEKHFFMHLCRKHQPTPAVRKLGGWLKFLGWPVEFEKFDGYKHIDIAIVKAKVNIEVDGSQHNYDKKQALADLKRTYYSFRKGFLTLRVPNCLTGDDSSIKETAEYIDRFLEESVKQLKNYN